MKFGLLTAVAEEATLTAGNRLQQNYPNPFNTETTISFVVAKSAYVELVVYNAVGQTVRTLVGGQCALGEHRSLEWVRRCRRVAGQRALCGQDGGSGFCAADGHDAIEVILIGNDPKGVGVVVCPAPFYRVLCS